MKVNLKQFEAIISDKKVRGLEKANENKANRDFLMESHKIALKILFALKDLNLTQQDLARKMDVSPQYISKMVKGRENFTLETIVKLENILNIDILNRREEKDKIENVIRTTKIITLDPNIFETPVPIKKSDNFNTSYTKIQYTH